MDRTLNLPVDEHKIYDIKDNITKTYIGDTNGIKK